MGEKFPALERLEDQISWYEYRAGRNRKFYAVLKAWSLAASTAAPVLVSFGLRDARTLATLTATIALAEAWQQLSQYRANWLLYRYTGEALKREKYLYLAGAGPYGCEDQERRVTLAERVEELLSGERGQWWKSRHERREAS